MMHAVTPSPAWTIANAVDMNAPSFVGAKLISTAASRKSSIRRSVNCPWSEMNG